MSLSIQMLDAARPGLEDLRLYADDGKEVPYLVERAAPTRLVPQAAKSFQVSLQSGATIISIDAGLLQALEGVTLESPALSFLKAVQIEGSADEQAWQTLTRGQPIFRQPGGASQLRLSFPMGMWRFLRLTVDDQRSPAVPFTGARLHGVPGENAPTEPLPASIAERHESPGETRLTLNLGAANLNLARIEVETPEPLFMRQAAFAAAAVTESEVREQTLAQGTIYRVAIEGQALSANLSMPVEVQVPSREVFLRIQNHDSPPLPITAVRAERRPVYLIFLAQQPGTYHLLAGNGGCAAPSYDLAALRAKLTGLAVSPITPGLLTNNPSYRLPEALPGVQASGALLDVREWRYRKPLQLTRPGAQQLELDLDVLAHAQPGLRDLRLLRDGQQVPYVLEHSSISRSLAPAVTPANDSKQPALSRWAIHLPLPGLPVTRLVCTSSTPLFSREMVLYEQVADDRGEQYRHTLGHSSWQQTPGRPNAELVLMLDSIPASRVLLLETDNGDNPPIELAQLRLLYPVARLLFKTAVVTNTFLYYGNAQVDSPRYDLGLVAQQLLAAEKATASLAAEEQLRKESWRETNPGKGGLIFWGVLGLVVVVLLIILSRLLPHKGPPAY